MESLKRPTVRVCSYIRKYAEFFADLCLQAYEFQEYSSHVLAGAIIASARRAVKIRPAWCPELQELTSLSDKDIAPAYGHIFAFYSDAFPHVKEN